MNPTVKTGAFVLIILVILAYATIQISKTNLLPGSNYSINVLVESATGINKKTPVQIAGIQVGYVADIELSGNNQARLTLDIDRDVKISSQVQARIKSLGFLGDTYIELYQPGALIHTLKEGDTVVKVETYGDFNALTGELSLIADDVKAITKTMRGLMAGDDSSFARSLKNIERITDALGAVNGANQTNMQAIAENLRALSENLNAIVARNMGNMDATLGNMAAITGKVRKGEGTVGKLINDEQTVEKLNDTIDNVNNLLGGFSRMQVDLGYHTEYLGGTEEFKHYVNLAIKPKPDKFFLFEFVDDPTPDSKVLLKNSKITSGGVTTEVAEEIETTNADQFLFSAQLAKKFYDFTFRGGLIESSGGVGVDYDYGLMGVKLSVFDFETKRGEKPHVKAMGTMNITRGIYLLGGMDDFLNKKQKKDWFMGAGLRVTDDDLKSLVGLTSLKP